MDIVVLIVVLLLPVTVSACEGGWVAHNGSCYHFSHDKEEQTGASVMCHLMGGHLVEIDTDAKMNYLSRIALLFQRNYWIGLKDPQGTGASWSWLESKRSLVATGYTIWDMGFPQPARGNNCGALYYGTSKWRNFDCTNEMFFICESDDNGLGLAPIG